MDSRRAWRIGLEAMAWRSVLAQAIRTLIGLLIGALLFWRLQGKVALMQEVIVFLCFGIFATFALFIGEWTWRTWIAPFKQRNEAWVLIDDFTQPRIEMDLDDQYMTQPHIRIKLSGKAQKAKPWLITIEPNETQAWRGPEPLYCDGQAFHVPLQPGGAPRYIELLQWQIHTTEGRKEIGITIEGTRFLHHFKLRDDQTYYFKLHVEDTEQGGTPCSKWFALTKNGEAITFRESPAPDDGIPNSPTPGASTEYP